MKMDIYAKLMLTVIAGALVGLVIQNSAGNAIADGIVQKVVICDANDSTSCAAVGRRANSTFNSLAVVDVEKM